jgi:hypothetical protein
MTTASVDAIERTVQKTNEWVADLERELGTGRRADADPGHQPERIRDRETFLAATGNLLPDLSVAVEAVGGRSRR